MNFNNGLLNREISTNRPDIQIQAHQKNELFGKTIYISEEDNGQFYDISILIIIVIAIIILYLQKKGI